MGIPAADWKNQEHRLADWLLLFLAGGITSLYLYQALLAEDLVYVSFVVLMAAWLAVYFSSYWQPVLYLVTAVIVGGTTLFWLFDGGVNRLLAQFTVVLHVLFVFVSGYLFYQEERRTNLGL